MNIAVDVLQAPTNDTLDAWLSVPRLAKCGKFFTPSESMWRPDKSCAKSINWKAAISCVPPEWQRWLHAVFAYRMAEVEQGTVQASASVMSRAAQAGLNPLREDHLIDLRERFNSVEFSALVAFMTFWEGCESVERRPSQSLIDAYNSLPRKKPTHQDVVLSLDPELGPLTRLEQESLYQWLHEKFCHNHLPPEQYLYLLLLMIYGQRGVQVRMSVFGDFMKTDKGCKIRVFWAKQHGDDAGWRQKSETFALADDLYNTVQAFKAIVLARLKQEYPSRADWDRAIENVPLFRHTTNTRIEGKKFPVLADLPSQKKLEDGPQSEFHVTKGAPAAWLKRLERQDDFPISHRTHEPLKITRGHRFRHTFGTDLSNAGLDEWSMAHALMHRNTQSVRRYRTVSADLMSIIDAKMSDHLAIVVNAFTGNIVKNRALAKNANREDRQIEDLAVCGADAACHLDTPFSCYGCGKFQPLLEADHRTSLERMERRRAQTIATDRTTGVIWDRAIMACRKVILDCEALMATSQSEKGGA